MKIKQLLILLSAVLFFAFVKEAKASIVTIEKTGGVTVNVLSAEDSSAALQSESLTVSSSSVEMGNADVPISLLRKDGKYLLSVQGKNGEQTFDVTSYKDRILEIEERPQTRKISISLSDNQFVIEQSGVRAKTFYQINVEPQNSRITILTPSGYKFLSVLPGEAVNGLYNSNTITMLGVDRSIEISEDEKGNLYYGISGFKRVGIKDLYSFDAPVSAKISAVNGEVMEINQPVWLKILYLFTLQT